MAATVGRSLRERSEPLLASFVRESGFAREDAEELLGAAQRFVAHAEDHPIVDSEVTTLRTQLARRASPGVSVQTAPHGCVLACIPANAPLPLGIIMPLALALAGNRVIVAAAGPTRRTALAAAAVVAEALEGSVALWTGGVRDAVEGALAHPVSVDALYFTGSSSHLGQLAAECAEAGVLLIYEGTGNTVAVVDDSTGESRLEIAAQQLVASKIFCNGQMCSAPNVIAVDRRYYEVFRKQFLQIAGQRALPSPLSALAGPETWARLEKLVAEGASANPNLRPDGRQAILIEGVPLEGLDNLELFCPASFLAPYDDFTDLLDWLASYRYRLQVSLFSELPERLRQVVARTRFARYTRGIRTTYQDPLLPWGNYGLSGISPVASFFEKGRRTVILEEGEAPLG